MKEEKYLSGRRMILQVTSWALILGVVLVLFFVFSKQNHTRILRLSESYVQDNSVQTAKHIDDVLADALDSIRILSYWYGESLEEPVVTSEDLQELTDRSPFDYVRFTDLSGANLTADDRTSDARDREYFQEGIAGKSGISVTQRSRITNETLVNFYTPLRYKGEIIGVLRGVYLADKQMKRHLTVSFFGEQANTFLCTKDLMLISESAEGEIFAGDDHDYLISHHYMDEETIQKIAQTFETGEPIGFNYRTDSGTGSGYIIRLDSMDWFLIRTFPVKVTGEMLADANRAGVLLETALILLFIAYIVMLLVTNRRQKKKLLDENRDMNYIIHGLPMLFDKFVLLDFEDNTYRYMLDEKPSYGEIAEDGAYPVLMKYILQDVKDEVARYQMTRFLNPEEIQRNMDRSTHDLKMDYETKHEPGKWKSLTLVCLERKDGKDGIPIRVLLAKQDITDAKNEEFERQKILRDATQAAEEASRAKSRFLFNMSHDIRTPMNAIIGFADLAEQKIDNQESVRNCITKIRHSSAVLLKIINDILDLARIESGKAVLQPSVVDLRSMGQGIRDMFADSMKTAGIAFTAEIDMKYACVMCDDMRMNQIAINLLSNAQKFTPSGGRVLFRFEQTGEPQDGRAQYRMIVRDNGIGMKPDFLPRAYDSFERERSSTTSGVQGTGLGLSIVKNLVEMMGGSIDLDSEPGKGTEFIICLTFLLVDGQNGESGKTKADPDRFNFAGRRILLVEDNELNREIAREILIAEGLLVEEAVDGEDAVKMVAGAMEGYYDLILMDIQMPKMNGYMATQVIRKLPNPKLAGIPIVAMTANAFDEDKKAAMEAGMNDHIAKPIDKEKLWITLKKALE